MRQAALLVFPLMLIVRKPGTNKACYSLIKDLALWGFYTS